MFGRCSGRDTLAFIRDERLRSPPPVCITANGSRSAQLQGIKQEVEQHLVDLIRIVLPIPYKMRRRFELDVDTLGGPGARRGLRVQPFR